MFKHVLIAFAALASALGAVLGSPMWRDNVLWAWADIIDEEAAYALYLARLSNGRYRADAEQGLEALAWRAAADPGLESDLRSYLGRYPNGAWAAEARRRIERLAWAAATAADTREAYEAYLHGYPNMPQADRAAYLADQRAWATAHARRTRDAYEGYLATYPAGLHIETARRRLDELR